MLPPQLTETIRFLAHLANVYIALLIDIQQCSLQKNESLPETAMKKNQATENAARQLEIDIRQAKATHHLAGGLSSVRKSVTCVLQIY